MDRTDNRFILCNRMDSSPQDAASSSAYAILASEKPTLLNDESFFIPREMQETSSQTSKMDLWAASYSRCWVTPPGSAMDEMHCIGIIAGAEFSEVDDIEVGSFLERP